MNDHVFHWDKATEGHVCRLCGTRRIQATPDAYKAYNDAHDAAGPDVSETVNRDGFPLYSLNVGTGKGYARAVYAFPLDGGTPTVMFQVNMRPVDAVPDTFRKFHAAHTPARIEAMRRMFAARVAIVQAEEMSPCKSESEEN